MTLYDKVLPREEIAHVYLLYASWILFALAIISTIISFQISKKGLEIQETFAERYYIDKEENAFDSKNWAAELTNKINIVSGASFVFAILSFVVLGVLNFDNRQHTNKEEKTTMSKKTSNTKTGQKGASIPKMQSVNTTASKVKGGATVPKPQTTKSVKKGTTK